MVPARPLGRTWVLPAVVCSPFLCYPSPCLQPPTLKSFLDLCSLFLDSIYKPRVQPLPKPRRAFVSGWEPLGVLFQMTLESNSQQRLLVEMGFWAKFSGCLKSHF